MEEPEDEGRMIFKGSQKVLAKGFAVLKVGRFDV
jgi:hypothetical protein